jgi:peptide/nickel transport system permease protein
MSITQIDVQEGATVAAAADATLPRRRRRSWARMVPVYIAFGWLVLLLVVALFAQWLPIHNAIDPVGLPNMSPNMSHEFLGTDTIGRSIVSRLAYGTRVSLGIAVISTAIAMFVGGLFGLVSAYFRGWVTWIVDIIANTVLAVPQLLLLLALVLALRPSITTLTAALSLVFVPAFTRLTRAQAQGQLSRDYVLAARFMGARWHRVLFREVLPNSVLALLTYAALVLPGVVVAAGSLSYLGFGVPAPTADWGSMIAQAQINLTTAPWPALIPCIALVITVISLNTASDYVRVRFDVRGSQL